MLFGCFEMNVYICQAKRIDDSETSMGQRFWLSLLFFLTLYIPSKAQTDFAIYELSDSIFSLMQGKSYPKSCKVKREELRYLKVLHADAKGETHKGELVCNKMIADDLIAIFKKLYDAKYPIERMQLIDNFDADDERSMDANNTSSFCYRVVNGSSKLSNHSLGMAIDINPLYNPYVRNKKVQPKKGAPYINRTRTFPYKIERGDLLWKLFTERGFQWGGAWRSLKDWQHFEKVKK